MGLVFQSQDILWNREELLGCWNVTPRPCSSGQPTAATMPSLMKQADQACTLEPCHVSEGSQEEYLALEFLLGGYFWSNRASNQPAPAQGLHFSHMGHEWQAAWDSLQSHSSSRPEVCGGMPARLEAGKSPDISSEGFISRVKRS